MKHRLIAFSVYSLIAFLLLAFFQNSTLQAASKKTITKRNASLGKISSRPKKDFRVHNVGTLWNMVTNYGSYGDPNSSVPSMEWPGGSQAYYLWEGRLWVGAILDGEKFVSHADYGDYEWSPTEGTDFYFGPGKSIQDHDVYYDDLRSIAGHTPLGLEVHERGLSWSMGDYDDFIIYEYEITNVGDKTLNGVFIGWIYDCDVATIADPSDPNIDDLVDYDGFDGNDTDTDLIDWVDPLDLDGDGNTGYDEYGFPYAWPLMKDGTPMNPLYDPSKVEPDGFYDEWTVLLDENGPELHWQTDKNPVGAAAGTVAELNGKVLHGYLVPRNTSLMFDGDYPQSAENDVGERSSPNPNTGFIGGRLIYSDIVNENDVFPYLTTPADTMMRPFAHQWWNWESDPGDDIEKYDYLDAQHEASTQLGKHYNFLPLPYDLNAPTFDYRWLTSTGPFNNFKPGDKIRAVYAAGVGLGLQGMRENLDNALKAYYAGSKHSNPYQPSAPDEDNHYVLPIPPQIPSLTYTPLHGGARLVWDNIAEITVDAMLGRTDFEGYKIYRSLYDPSSWEVIAAFDNVDGKVLVKNTDGIVINAKKDPDTGKVVPYGDPRWENISDDNFIKVDLPPITHSYDDQGGEFLGREISRPINGLQYFYAVVAYDPDKEATADQPALGSQESAKSNYMKDPKNGAPLAVIPTNMYAVQVVQGEDLKNMGIRVVPNPYRGTALFESRYEDKIRFTNLPPACKISIFTMTGDLVETIYHDNGTDAELWDLISRNNQKAVSGLYVYVVETEQPKYEKFVGKFVIVR
ncbi:MAG: hypothetical protein GWP06_04015 [Actinobacteria bacterium]|nr:hypothetical protein [Actinomycetota bacterium]